MVTSAGVELVKVTVVNVTIPPTQVAVRGEPCMPAAVSVTVLPVSQVPVIEVGLVVYAPPAGEVNTGAGGAVISTVNDIGPLVALPAWSVIVAVTVYVPSVYAGAFLVQVTDVPVAGVGVQVNPGMVTLSPMVVTMTIGVLALFVRYGASVSPPTDVTVRVGAILSTVTLELLVVVVVGPVVPPTDVVVIVNGMTPSTVGMSDVIVKDAVQVTGPVPVQLGVTD
jgi:hypothetical protein